MALKRGNWSRRIFVLVIALVLSVSLTAGTLWHGRLSVVCGCLLVGLACAPLLARLHAEPLDGPGLYGLMTLVTFAITGLAWVGTPDNAGPWLVPSDVGRALAVTAAGVVAFTVGALLSGGPARAPSGNSAAPASAPGAFAACYVVTLTLTAVGLAAGWYGYIASEVDAQSLGLVASALPFVAQLSRVVILGLALEWLRTGEQRLRRLLIVLVLTQTLIGFIAGVKGESLYPLLFTGLAFIAARRRPPLRLIAVSAALIVFVLLPANLAYRQAVRAHGDRSVATVARAVGDPGTYRPDRTLRESADFFFTRFRNIDDVALIVRDTPSVYAYGDVRPYVLLAPMVVIPRQLWSGKPTLDTAAQFAYTYWEIPPSGRTSQPLTQVGDLFRTFGLGGVVLGLALWGLVVGWWTRLWRNRRSPRWDAVYLYALVIAVTYVESDLPILVATTAKAVPLAAAVAWLLLPGRTSPPGYRLVARMMRNQFKARPLARAGRAV
jgi:hypothetical protein